MKIRPLAELLNLRAPAARSWSLDHPRFAGLTDLQAVAAGTGKIARGSQGEGVRRLQHALQDMGFYISDSLDGQFGPRTRTALVNFQDSQKLPRTGQLDQATLITLNRVAPPPGQTLVTTPAGSPWGSDQNLIPTNLLADGRRARAVIDLSEKRLFFYDARNRLKHVGSVATGNGRHPDGKGVDTSPGLRVVNGRNDNPAAIGQELWEDPKAFGTRLLDLSLVDPVTGKRVRSGQELHGTYARGSMGTQASHGCIRVLNEDIELLYDGLRNGDLIDVRQ